MVTAEQGTTTALNLAGRAAELLDAVGDRAGALRLRHTAAIIRDDARYPAPDGLEVPLSLMRMALALMDRGGHHASGAAACLQEAIDHARGAKPPATSEEIDVALLAPSDPAFSENGSVAPPT